MILLTNDTLLSWYSQNGLVCFQRGFTPRSVPGCNGDAFQIGSGDDDFCIQASANTLNFRGDNGQPASAFPLGNCQGGKSIKWENGHSLPCWNRTPLNMHDFSIPSLWHYIIDCDNDDECAGNLVCFQRDEFEDVPGCLGFGVSGFDYCATSNRDGDGTEPASPVIGIGNSTTENETEEGGGGGSETPEGETSDADKDYKEDTMNRFYLYGGGGGN